MTAFPLTNTTILAERYQCTSRCVTIPRNTVFHFYYYPLLRIVKYLDSMNGCNEAIPLLGHRLIHCNEYRAIVAHCMKVICRMKYRDNDNNPLN